ncbi:DEKNAAC103628 [Brettanomyces naardenensis]|uniref:DEKNAAC103628 n=1 Tax=Brettanomyces naardenensis TaxID=13370 RepID=A0A448YNV8_BRENA|nr:DEKNAAC103628 [Brettanomyces naardenensis]
MDTEPKSEGSDTAPAVVSHVPETESQSEKAAGESPEDQKEVVKKESTEKLVAEEVKEPIETVDVKESVETTDAKDTVDNSDGNSLKRESSETIPAPPFKKFKTDSPTPQPIPQLKQENTKRHEVKINKPVEEIIDGSDLRKFLNKNLTPFLIRGLNEMAEGWEKGTFTEMDTRSVLAKFSGILAEYAKESAT